MRVTQVAGIFFLGEEAWLVQGQSPGTGDAISAGAGRAGARGSRRTGDRCLCSGALILPGLAGIRSRPVADGRLPKEIEEVGPPLPAPPGLVVQLGFGLFEPIFDELDAPVQPFQF